MQICSGGADPCASISRYSVFGSVRINLVFTLQFDQRWNFVMGSSFVALNRGFITNHSVQNTHGYHVATNSSSPSTLLPFDQPRANSQKLLSPPADVMQW